jgi:hypothetical protein
VNWGSKSTNERGPSYGWLLGLVVPVQEIFVLTWLHYFNTFVPITTGAGSGARSPFL